MFVVNVADICCQFLERTFCFKVSGKHVVVDVSCLFIYLSLRAGAVLILRLPNRGLVTKNTHIAQDSFRVRGKLILSSRLIKNEATALLSVMEDSCNLWG